MDEAKWGNHTGKRQTPLTSIKNFCLECMGGILYEWEDSDGMMNKPYKPHNDVTNCPSVHCHLYPYRKGRKPKG